MSKKFLSEKEGQIKFFEDLKISTDIELTYNTDGVYLGTIFEFKLTISDINKVLFQAIKYLSHRRIKGESVPAQILLVALNEENAYLFNSGDFLKEIEIPYTGAASKNNTDFNTKIQPERIDYSKIKGLGRITEILDVEKYTKINIDLFDVVGWAQRFYRENPSANKIKFFKELRVPKYFENFIYPWKGDESDFKYIMDLLNDNQHKKELGAFYTPPAYCRKATELVRKAIKQIPKGNDYIILDRSAGTGNLEEFLTDKNVKDISIGELSCYIDKDLKQKYLQDKADIITTFYSKKNFNEITIGELEKHKTKISLHDFIFDNELSHTIVNTYELKEWLVLNERIGDKVKMIIPPPQEINNKEALVEGGDALSERFIIGQKTKEMTKEYNESISTLLGFVQDKKTNIILYENPPFRDETSNSHMEGKSSLSFAKKVMKENIGGSAVNDLSNQFIWSGFQYYLKKPDDYYILFSPIKYWKSLSLSNKKFEQGFLFNRKHFHTNSSSAIACILWKNEFENKEKLNLSIWDIESNLNDGFDNLICFDKGFEIKKVYKPLSKFYDKRDDKNDKNDGVICGLDGVEEKDKKSRVVRKFNKNIIGYIVAQQFGFENPRLSTNLTRIPIYNGNGFFLRSDNFIDKLPLFTVGKMPMEKIWWLNGTVFKTSDGGEKYTKDTDFLKSCFLFTCLSYFNKCRSLNGSDKRFYKNELCFDKETLASEYLKKYKLTNEEQDLLDIFYDMLKKAKKTKNYNSKYTYGTYQIDQELNTRRKNENDEWIYDYPELNTALNTLRAKLTKYYESIIQPKLFEFELLK
ncbi:MAG: hypothetical protein PHN69_03370 [Candidatus Pacebacteria bacterium]|nr:hypothetical protein [Candidatus Paceibacterota bacterium]